MVALTAAGAAEAAAVGCTLMVEAAWRGLAGAGGVLKCSGFALVACTTHSWLKLCLNTTIK